MGAIIAVLRRVMAWLATLTMAGYKRREMAGLGDTSMLLLIVMKNSYLLL